MTEENTIYRINGGSLNGTHRGQLGLKSDKEVREEKEAWDNLTGGFYKQLVFAIKTGDIDSVNSVLETYKKLKETIKNNPKIQALMSGWPPLFKDINYQDENGVTPLMLAISTGNASIIEAVIKAGADINRQNKNGMTPLMMAAQMGQTYTFQLLMEKGANPELQDNKGCCALDFAPQNKKAQIEAIIRGTYNPIKQPSEGKTTEVKSQPVTKAAPQTGTTYTINQGHPNTKKVKVVLNRNGR